MTAPAADVGVPDVEKETQNRLIDAARTYLVFVAERHTRLAEAIDRLNRQAYGSADRLRGAAQQLRRRFAGAEAISLLEAAAEHAEASAEPGTVGPTTAETAALAT